MKKSTKKNNIWFVFGQQQNNSKYCFQYECCGERWWGGYTKNKCRECEKTVQKLPLEQIVGIGWFKCECSRIYAGFSRGDVTSKCFACNTENLPKFIQRGNNPRKKENTGNSHNCNQCKGSNRCPIVAQARQYSSNLRSAFGKMSLNIIRGNKQKKR